jgi:hypothetical protein
MPVVVYSSLQDLIGSVSYRVQGSLIQSPFKEQSLFFFESSNKNEHPFVASLDTNSTSNWLKNDIDTAVLKIILD